jgi:regulation of enolase protein 1 (concanavalin A-like superfamily)
MYWLNEPPCWRIDGNTLHVTTGEKTDFWRETHYGFIRDGGHLYFERAGGDFTAEVTVAGSYQTLYDQAGLMLRIDERNWIKAGLEFVGGKRLLSCVVTREASDWSIVSGFDAPEVLTIRLTRQGTAARVEWTSGHGAAFETFRLAYFPLSDEALIGPMCCSPQRAGFQVRFDGFNIEPIEPSAVDEFDD